MKGFHSVHEIIVADHRAIRNPLRRAVDIHPYVERWKEERQFSKGILSAPGILAAM